MRILIVEDDPQINNFLTASLRSEYFLVDSVQDGEKGLYLAQTNEYDLIILDYILPHVTGLEICEKLRQNEIASPIIGLSVKSDIANKVQFLNAGADDYLTKPFSFEELHARIRALLRRPNILNSDIIEISDIVLNIKTHTVTKAAKLVYLTKKEFALLEYLMRNRGTVISRGMLLEHVWDMNADPFSNTIETHIMTLRRKVDNNRKSRLIHTVPGIGYKFDFF